MLKSRMEEHKAEVRNQRPKVAGEADPAISKGHALDWDTTRVIAPEQYTVNRLVHEALAIHTPIHTLNRDRGRQLRKL